MKLKNRLIDILFGVRIDLAVHLSRELALVDRLLAIVASAETADDLATQLESITALVCEFEAAHETMLSEAIAAGYLTYQWQDLYDLGVSFGRVVRLIESHVHWVITLRDPGPNGEAFARERRLIADATAFLASYRDHRAASGNLLERIGDEIREMARAAHAMVRRLRRDAPTMGLDERRIRFIEEINDENARIHDLLAKLQIVAF
jgi:hypothetical protein